MKSTKYKKEIIIFNFIFAIILTIFNNFDISSSMFSDMINPEKTIKAATLELDVTNFKILDSFNNEHNNIVGWTPHNINTITFDVENTGYDDISLNSIMEIYWNNDPMRNNLILLYPSTMTDAQIQNDIENNNSNSSICGKDGIVTLENGQTGISCSLSQNILKGNQGAETNSEKTITYNYKIVFNTVRYDLNYIDERTLNVDLKCEGKYAHNSELAWNSSDSGKVTFETIDEDRDPIEIITEVVDKRIDDHISNPTKYPYQQKSAYVGDFVRVGKDELYDMEFIHYDTSKDFYVTYVEKHDGTKYTNKTVYDIKGSEWEYTGDGNPDAIPYNTLQDIYYKKYAENHNMMNQLKLIFIGRKNEINLFQDETLPDGAISKQRVFWEYLGDLSNIDSFVSPYFASIGSKYMLSDISSFDEVKNYINWYFDNILLENTLYANGAYYAPAGVIYDYEYNCSSKTSCSKHIYNPNDPFDSVDSYGATFLSLLKEYVIKTGDTAIITDNMDKIELVASSIVSVYDKDVKLTHVKPNYNIHLTMDNLEVVRGLNDLKWLYDNVLNDPTNLNLRIFKNIANNIEDQIENTLLLTNGNFKFYKYYYEELDGDAYYRVLFPEGGYYNLYGKYYPDILIQLYPLLLGLKQPSDTLNTTIDNPLYIHNSSHFSGNEWWSFNHGDANIFPQTEALVANLMMPSGTTVGAYDYDYQIELAMGYLLFSTRGMHYDSTGTYVSLWDTAESGYAIKAFELYLEKHYK